MTMFTKRWVRAAVCTLLYAIMAAHICSDKCTFIIIRIKLLMSGRLWVRKVHLLIVIS